MITIETLLGRLEGVRRVNYGWMAKCPAHDDRHPSLSINERDGRLLLHCHAGCETKAIVAAINLTLADLGPNREPQPARRRIIAVYPYLDETGTLLYEVVRYEPKDFRQRRPNREGDWIWNLKGVRRILYRLPELLAADPSSPVFIVEGEKDADRLASMGLIATTNAGGANSPWLSGYCETLTGRSVVIIPDNDEPGRSHAVEVARALHGIAASSKIIELPGLPSKGDVSDWLGTGKGTTDLLELVAATKEWQPNTSSPSSDPEMNSSDYEATEYGLVWHQPTRSGRIPTRLTNFTARILREIIKDDGAETQIIIEIEAKLGKRVCRGQITSANFSAMRWPVELLGAGTIIYPARGEHARCAVSQLSGEIPQQRVFAHTGWREFEGETIYLHAGGAIGERGTLPLCIELNGSLADYHLPEPPSLSEWSHVMRASLEILDVADEMVTVPALGSVWDAVLGGADYSVFVEGGSGERKSAFTAILQAHWGERFTGDHLPANWQTTANANAEKQHLVKDALLVIDDYKPGIDARSRARLEHDAERIFRGAANHSGRGRMNADGKLRVEKPPRCLTLASGEDVPPGQSLRARLLIIRMRKNAMDLDRLLECQQQAERGVYAAAMAGYLRWIAPRIGELRRTASNELARLRDDLRAHLPGHGRTPAMIARLYRAWWLWLEAARECGAIDEEEHGVQWRRVQGALIAVGREQSGYQQSQDPARRFVELLTAAITSGRAHVADAVSGRQPQNAGIWGWRAKEFNLSNGGELTWEPHGERIGWVNGSEHVYLQPDASFQIAQKIAAGGEGLAVSQQTLWRRLGEAGMIAARDGLHLTVKRMIEETRRRVIVMRAELLNDSPPAE